MRYYNHKEEILETANSKIKGTERLIVALEFLKNEIVLFDNKVFNKRVTNIINKKHKEIYKWDYNDHNSYASFHIEYNTTINVYINYDTETYVSIDLNDNRIQADSTVKNIDEKIKSLNNRKEKLMNIDEKMLDEFIEKKEKIESLVRDFNKNIIDNELNFVDDFYLVLRTY